MISTTQGQPAAFLGWVMTIDTREELINALHVACEIEHSLLVQYLYTALSVKRSLDEGLTPDQQALLRTWQTRIYQIAREEMGHLGIACNLLSAIGAAPKFGRHPMPSASEFFPFPFDLIPFGDEALYRFLVFELPRDHPPPPPPGADLGGNGLAIGLAAAPEPLQYEFVGELYAKISAGFEAIPETDLFIGPQEAQSGRDWSDPSLDMRPVTDRASALSAIQNVIEDGEGTPQNSAQSHYSGFLNIRQRYFDEGRFDATRRIPRNPVTRDSPGRNVSFITNETSRLLVELFNASYGVMLLLLQHYFSLAPKTAAEASLRQELQRASQRIMSVAVRPLAEECTLAPFASPDAPERAGPSFEIYSDVSLSPFPQARIPIVLERLDAFVRECVVVGAVYPRVTAIGETVAILRNDLSSVGRV